MTCDCVAIMQYSRKHSAAVAAPAVLVVTPVGHFVQVAAMLLPAL